MLALLLGQELASVVNNLTAESKRHNATLVQQGLRGYRMNHLPGSFIDTNTTVVRDGRATLADRSARARLVLGSLISLTGLFQ